MIVRHLSFCVLIFLLPVTKAYSQEVDYGTHVDEIAWGEVVNGLQLGISPAIKWSKTYEIEGVAETVVDAGTLNVSVHLRNVGKSPLRFLPSVWDCLAMGDGGAVTVSKIVLTPVESGKSLMVTHHGWNHLRLLDKRRRESESWQETLCKSAPGAKDMELDEEEAKERQIELAAGDSVWPLPVKFTLDSDSKSLWRISEKSSAVPAGRYRITAVLLINQPASEWKGKLTSGPLNLQLPAEATN